MNLVELDNLVKLIHFDNAFHKSEHLHKINYLTDNESYSTIFENYIFKNIPFLMPLPNNWNCLQKWSVSNVPNFEYLLNQYGSAVVPVANCGQRYFNSQAKENILLKDFLTYWKKYIDLDYPNNMECLYMKDWHFNKDFPDENVYTVPKYFSSDWLNEYLLSNENSDLEGTINNDDYRFIYMGPKGTWTPLHSDVFSSFSWSANICGKKKWIFYPPGEENYLKDKFGNLAYDVASKDINQKNVFSNFNSNIKYYELIQGAGDIVFVPSGWHHQVWNLDDTISINHNWINGCNIIFMFQSLLQQLNAVKKEIKDCQDMDGWDDHCQIMLKASFGTNYIEFYKFLRYIAATRIKSVKTNEPIVMYCGWKLGINHAIFDLIKINQIFNNIVVDNDFSSLDFFKNKVSELKLFIKEINQILVNSSCTV